MIRTPKSKQLIGRSRGYDIISVSAFEVRGMEEDEEEFGLYSLYLDLPGLVPQNEIWLAEEGKAEWPIFLEGAFTWIKTGEYNEAVKAERIARGGLQLGTITDAWYLQYIKYIPDPKDRINVWFIDGKIVRDNFKTDFVEGGHHYVYPWIPREEIWIADSVPEEWPFLLIHEYTELRLMRDRNLTYEEAHKRADDVEWEARQRHQKR